MVKKNDSETKIKKMDFVLIGLGIIVMLGMFIFLAAPQWLFTKGEMLSEQKAKEIKDEILVFYAKKENKTAVPAFLKELNPLSIDADDNGVLIIFRKDSYQKYGYYYCRKDLEPPESKKDHCVKKITECVYFYHDAF